MKKILIGASQIIVFAIIHTWILIECINFTDMISAAMKESESIRESYSNPYFATLLMFIFLPVFEGAVIGLIFWLIYREVGIEKIALYIMVAYLVFSFVFTMINNVDYNSRDAAYSILMIIINYILSGAVFVCSILPMTAYGDSFERFFRKTFEIKDGDHNKVE